MIQNEIFGFRVRYAHGTVDVLSTDRKQAATAARILSAADELLPALLAARDILASQVRNFSGPAFTKVFDGNGASRIVSKKELLKRIDNALAKVEG